MMGSPCINTSANDNGDNPQAKPQLPTIASSAEETLGDWPLATLENSQHDHGTRTLGIEENLAPLDTKGGHSAPLKPSELPLTNRQTYTIPSYASWFSWNRIHETERRFLKEFFDGRSPSKTPKIYKDYRDFMINKYRDNPLKRLTFTEVRKLLVGDVNSIRKVYDFMETWGLINFQAVSGTNQQTSSKEMTPIVLDNIIPTGVRVISPSNPVKSVMSQSAMSTEVDRTVTGVHPATLASYKDVFAQEKLTEASAGPERKTIAKLFCNNCRAECTANRFDCQKAGFVLCPECFEDGKYGLGMSVADFKQVNLKQDTSEPGNDRWTDQETLLLLEATMLHGDNWKCVAQHVGTKSEVDCVMELIQLPFGEQFMGFVGTEGSDRRSSNIKSENKVNEQAFSLKDSSAQNYQEDDSEEDKHNTEDDISGPPLKRRHITSLTDVGKPIMAQVAALSAMVGPHVAAAAAQAAVAALCEEDPSASQMISIQETKSINQKFDFTGSGFESKRSMKEFELEECRNEFGGTVQTTNDGDSHSSGKNMTTPTLQMRAAIAIALGAAAAHAKLLADQEDREIEHLMSTIIENQLKKLLCKIQHFEELELIMEKEYSVMEQIKELLLADRIHFVQQTVNSGFSGSQDKGLDKLQAVT